MKNYEDINTIGRIAQAELELEDKYSKFFQEIASNFYLAQGYIYSQSDLNKLIRERRPTFQYNLFLPIISRILGGFKNSIIGVDIIPKNPQDQELAEVMKSINDFLLYQANDIEYEISKAFAYAVIGRIGWIKQDFLYTPEYPEGIVDIKFYDTFKIKFDINTQRRDLKDCNYLSDTGWYSVEDIINIYAQDDNDLKELIIDRATTILGESSLTKYSKLIKTWAEKLFDAIGGYKGEDKGYDVGRIKNLNEFLDKKDGLFKVIDWYEKRLVKTLIIKDNIANKEYDVSELIRKEDNYLGKDWYDKDKLDKILQDFNIEAVDIIERTVNRIFQISVLPALNIKLYDGLTPLSNYKFVPIFCYDYHPDILETKAVVDAVKDAVKSANHRRNTMLTYITRVAHGGWIAEESAVKGYIDELLSNEIVGVKVVRDGSLAQGRIQPIPIPQFPTALDKLQVEDMEFVKLISGVRDNALATSESSRESGILFSQKVMQSELIQEWISDNAQSALLQIAKNNLEYVQKFFTEQRLIRIIDDKNTASFLPINYKTELGIINDVTKGEYDVIVSKTPYGKHQRETEFNKLVQVMQLLASVNPAYIDPIVLLKASGLKNANELISHIQNVINQQLAIQQQQTQNPNPNHKNINLEQLANNLNLQQ